MFHRKRKPFPIYDSIFFDIIICDNDQEINKELGEPEDETWYASCSKTHFKDENGSNRKSVTVVFQTGHEFDPITPRLMVHEAVHAKNMVFQQIGQKPTCKSGADEAEAYFVEWIYQELQDFFDESMKIEKEQVVFSENENLEPTTS